LTSLAGLFVQFSSKSGQKCSLSEKEFKLLHRRLGCRQKDLISSEEAFRIFTPSGQGRRLVFEKKTNVAENCLNELLEELADVIG
jgi:hypothetical protein